MPKYLPSPHKFRPKTLDSTDTVDFTHFRRTVNQYCGLWRNYRCSWLFNVIDDVINKKRYDSELPYQRPDLIEVMEIEIDLTKSTNVHTSFYISVRECIDC